MKRQPGFADLGQLHLEDIGTFLAVYRKAAADPAEKRDSYNKLFRLGTPDAGEPGIPTTTVISHLKRVIDFLFPGGGSRTQGGTKYGFQHLFAERSPGAGLEPTPAAHELYKRFCVLADFYRTTRKDVVEAIRKTSTQPILRIGAAQSFSFRLLSAMLSACPNPVPGPGVRLEVETLTSVELLQRLHMGLLTCVFGFGFDRPQEPGLDVAFRPLGLPTRTVLLCHPNASLHTKEGSRTRKAFGPDVNHGYWKERYAAPPKTKVRGRADAARSRPQRPTFQELRSIEIDEIDFGNPATPPLLFVPSYAQAERLEDWRTDLTARGAIHEVPWYEEALALVRMNLGIAVAPEQYCQRSGITAFRLEPAEVYARSAGVFYNTRLGIAENACMLAHFVREYLERFTPAVQAAAAPTFVDPEFQDFCAAFNTNRDWKALAAAGFPVVDDQ